jgi:peptide methionine sulfoxide reductase MsrB
LGAISGIVSALGEVVESVVDEEKDRGFLTKRMEIVCAEHQWGWCCGW